MGFKVGELWIADLKCGMSEAHRFQMERRENERHLKECLLCTKCRLESYFQSKISTFASDWLFEHWNFVIHVVSIANTRPNFTFVCSSSKKGRSTYRLATGELCSCSGLSNHFHHDWISQELPVWSSQRVDKNRRGFGRGLPRRAVHLGAAGGSQRKGHAGEVSQEQVSDLLVC